LRGFGESGGRATNVAEFEALSAKRLGDVDAMLAYLLQQSGVDTSRVAAGGASCGVTLSTDLAARHHEIKTLIELSGLATDATRAYIAQAPGVAIFGAASEGDGGAAQSMKDLVKASNNPESKLGIYPGTEHGVAMFSKNPELESAIVIWMKTQLIQNGATR
jgi:dienelactone hydrolase